MHSERVFTRHAVPGLKIVYGGKPSLFTQNIRAIRYLFVNPEGKTICFEARAKTADPDWSEANNLVLNTLSLATAHSSSDWGNDIKTGFGSSLIATRPTLLVVAAEPLVNKHLQIASYPDNEPRH